MRGADLFPVKETIQGRLLTGTISSSDFLQTMTISRPNYFPRMFFTGFEVKKSFR